MSAPTTENQIQTNTPTQEWEAPTPPENLIYDDGEPLESNRHRIAMNLLIESVYEAWTDREDYFAGGNMFIYYSRTQAKNRDFRGPDFFVTLNVDGSQTRQAWVVWDENGRYPDAIVELMSASTANVDLNEKKQLYQNVFRTRDYFVYDPFNPDSLQGWHLDNNFVYQPLESNERGWLWCETLGFWLGTWQGIILRETAFWLRFYDSEGNLVLLAKEAEQRRAEVERERAEVERERAERLAARLRELGEDPDSL
ncbi:MAG: Uma2 family endonuclease [Oscillatoria sp. PMC 1068.18]|nr:Uma2 family endonuclease [Oscillatoria sp. PMC 1076.18]MEC4990651.1 Uma2 family endonuclease [Oscillatoria sp. PMC 1068.18]